MVIKNWPIYSPGQGGRGVRPANEPQETTLQVHSYNRHQSPLEAGLWIVMSQGLKTRPPLGMRERREGLHEMVDTEHQPARR